jgi:hypothetical protein
MYSRILTICTAFWALATLAAAQVRTVNYNSGEDELFDGSNNTASTAGPLLSGGLYAPTFYVSTDVDYYSIHVGDVPSTLTVLVDGIDNLFLACDPKAWLANSSGTILVENDNIAYPYNLDAYFRYVFTAPGDYYVAAANAGEWNYNYSNYYISGSYSYPDPDATAPAFEGIRSAVRRVEGYGASHSARVSWNAATDNRTASAEIRYNVYMATSSTVAAVFAGPPVATVTGRLNGVVPGLSTDLNIEYWFGVRARDAAGNEDQNTRVLPAVLQTAVPSARWPRYR